MIDLTQFCSRDPEQEFLLKPWSRGEYTYATNGHIMVRVPRRDDVPENKTAPGVTKLWRDVPDGPLSPIRPDALPPPVMIDCEACEGTGRMHECPSCQCPCATCAGTKGVEKLAEVKIGAHYFASNYIRMMLALPGIAFAPPAYIDHGKLCMAFYFDGGDGLLMGRVPGNPELVIATLMQDGSE